MRSECAIRRATPDDVPILVAHRRGMFEAMGAKDRGALASMDVGFGAWVRERLATEEYVGFLAVDRAGRVVSGVGVWLLDWPPTANDPTRIRGYLLNMFTEPEYRRKGLGRRLLAEALGWCRRRGIRTVVLHASDAGRPLYESLGFERTNEMRLRLPTTSGTGGAPARTGAGVRSRRSARSRRTRR